MASILAYPDVDPREAALAMKIGDTYRLHDIGLPEWRELAAQVRTDGDALVGRVRAIAAELPDRLSDEVRKMNTAGCSCAAIDRLVPVLVERVQRVANQ